MEIFYGSIYTIVRKHVYLANSFIKNGDAVINLTFINILQFAKNNFVHK